MTTLTYDDKLDQPAEKRRKNAKLLDYLRVNRNLMNEPIARSPRAHLNWRRNRKEKFRYYTIGNVTVRLPLDCSLGRKHATGFDMRVLFTLTALAKSRGGGKLRLSKTELLRHMDQPVHNTNRARLDMALKFWQHATIIWEKWNFLKTYNCLEINGFIKCTPEGIRVSRKWLQVLASGGYYQTLPLTLPVDATVQNLILLILAQTKRDEDLCGKRKFTSRRQITRLIGLNSHDRNRKLIKALHQAAKWFEQHGGSLDWKLKHDGSFVVWFREPRIHWL